MFLFDKIKSKYFCRAKIQKEKLLRKNSLYYTEKNSSFVDVFLEKFTNYFMQKKNPCHAGKDYQYHFTI